MIAKGVVEHVEQRTLRGLIRVPRSRRWSTLNGLTLAEAVKSKEFAIYLFATTSRDLAEEYYTNMIKDKNPMLTDYITGKNCKKASSTLSNLVMSYSPGRKFGARRVSRTQQAGTGFLD